MIFAAAAIATAAAAAAAAATLLYLVFSKGFALLGLGIAGGCVHTDGTPPATTRHRCQQTDFVEKVERKS